MGRYENALHFTANWEGGKVDRPEDKGGRTNQGVTQGTYNYYRQAKGLPVRDVWEIAEDEVKAIYLTYWVNSSAGAFETPLYAVAFDTAVNFGIGRWKQFFREASGFSLTEREKVRRLTENEELAIAEKVVARRKGWRRLRVETNPSQKVFYRGWIRRDQALEKFVRENA